MIRSVARGYANVASTLALVVAAAGGAYAAGRGSGTEAQLSPAHGCVGKDGTLRVVRQAGSCHGSERAVLFGARGVKGQPGATGAAGAAGPARENRANRHAGTTRTTR